MTDGRVRNVVPMNGLGTRVEGVLVHMGDVTEKLRVYPATLIRADPSATCKKLINLRVAHFTATLVEAPCCFWYRLRSDRLGRLHTEGYPYESRRFFLSKSSRFLLKPVVEVSLTRLRLALLVTSALRISRRRSL